jgi:DNA-directed RNA polymerase specialized sigma24 family protein
VTRHEAIKALDMSFIRCQSVGNSAQLSTWAAICEGFPVPSDDPRPDWIISSCFSGSGPGVTGQEQLTHSARRVWPYVCSHVSRELGAQRHDPENATLAAEVWEDVLQSVARSLGRSRVCSAEIDDMDAYLVGVFRHRFNRIRSRQKQRERTIQLIATAAELDAIAAKRGLYAVFDCERRVLAKEVFGVMDQWLRRVWTARQYGYSWKEIAGPLNKPEASVKVRFRYKLARLRVRFGG